MAKILQIRLSSKDVMSDVNYISVRPWLDRVKVMRFDYCSKKCEHTEGHDYNFDGQIFFKKGTK